ncbi:hypothetical protein DFH07DRAFT_1015355 [Mycena maculata]|uniref:Xylanolytic transcriptional activator regulatory domain-containing protein n=1 Tax=Mycena maculata TaxID=230809 RepID=A0AAD7MG54_9AGAR|nr:hypothetical protein DFH07DRAFT_1015355 [Mycena maculata]
MDASPPSFSFLVGYEHPDQHEEEADKSAVSKGPKRKRLAKPVMLAIKASDGAMVQRRAAIGISRFYVSLLFLSDVFSYFASKPCHYTDASGRPVAAPHTGKPDASRAPRNGSARSKMYSEEARLLPSTSQVRLDSELATQHRKRVKNDRPHTLHSQDMSNSSGPVKEDDSKIHVAPPVLDHALTRELTNLIHKPSFSASLSHNRVPSYLLYAICALAAPLSRQPRIRTAPPRLSGRPFAHQAVSLMFDGSGHLLCDPNLFTAQALCLLMAHDHVTRDMALPVDLRYRDLVLQIVQALGVHNSEHPVSTPAPPPQNRYTPPLSANPFSEGADTNLSTLGDLEKRGEEWASSLPDHLRFSEQNLQVQHSMFETSSNTGAWCFCCMHVYFASLTLALHAGGRNHFSHSTNTPTLAPSRPQWTITRLEMIMKMLGDRAKNSMLMGAFIWTQIKYCNRDDTQIRRCCNEYEELWGTRISDLVAVSTTPRCGSPPIATSQTYPRGRSLDELRLHAQGNNWSSAPQLGSGSGFREDNNAAPRRLHTEVDGDSPKHGGRIGESLPSLKSSGLLDSWNPVSLGKARTDIRESSSKSSPAALGMESDVRSTTLSMPVGLQWLANESR